MVLLAAFFAAVPLRATAASCTYALGATSRSTGPSAGSGSIAVSGTPAGCSGGWSAASDSSWLTLGGTASGSGAGAWNVDYAFTQSSGGSRTAHVVVTALGGASVSAPSSFTLTQSTACTAGISSPGGSYGAGGGAGTFELYTGADCSWSVASDAAWLAVTSPPSGSGAATVWFTVAPNPGGVRAGHITVAGLTFTATQSAGGACFSLATHTNPAGVGGVTIRTAEDCPGGHTGGSTVSLEAQVPSGYTFAGWTGTGGSFSNDTTLATVFTITGAADVTANFLSETGCYPLTTEVHPAGAGTVTVVTPPDCTGGWKAGTSVTVQAAADPGYAFDRWSATGCQLLLPLASSTVCVIAGTGPAALSASFLATTSGRVSKTIPIVLSTSGLAGSFYTSELSITNRSTAPAGLAFTYTAAFGGGGGSATTSIAPGTQKIVPDALEYLRGIGVPIPASGNRGGTLAVDVTGAPPADLSLTVRTTTALPGGRAGLAYRAVDPEGALAGAAVLGGLVQNALDRTNLALVNTGSAADGDVTLRVAITSGDPLRPGTVVLPDVTLGPGGFMQFPEVLRADGFPASQGWARVTRVGGTAPWYAYAVVNDQKNSDGSFVTPVAEGSWNGRTRAVVPVIVETGSFVSELIVANTSDAPKTVTLTYVADPITNTGNAATTSLSLAAREQRIVPSFVSWLRSEGAAGVPPPGTTFTGALFVFAADLSGLFVGARTMTPDTGAGRFGLFYTAIRSDEAATSSAVVCGLQQNAENRSNLAIVNVGDEGSGDDTFRVDVVNGETGFLAGTRNVTLGARRFVQIGGVLPQLAAGTANAWVRVTRTSGSGPFLAYGVVNDGGSPGERSGDGAFIAMERP